MLKLMTTNRRSRNSWLLPVAFLATWGLAMYALSAQPTLTSSQEWMVLTPIRKGAHIIEFAVLTGIVWVVLSQLRRIRITQRYTEIAQRYTKMLFFIFSARYWLAFLISLGCAILDETHQYFVPNRQATVSDVLIDTVGIGLTLGLIWLWHNRYLVPTVLVARSVQRGRSSVQLN